MNSTLKSVLRSSPRSDQVKYEYSRTIVEKLRSSDSVDLPKLVDQNVGIMRPNVSGLLTNNWLDDWQRLSRGPREDLYSVLLGEDEYSIEMRNNSPLIGILTQQERLKSMALL